MLDFHWMHRQKSMSPLELRKLFSDKEKFGYKSILLTWKDFNSDYFIKAAATVNPQHKIKYMIAIRPYAISPRYFAMQVAAFNEICHNRIMLNIVSGEVLEAEQEPDPCFDVEVDISTPPGRLEYVPIWLEKFIDSNVLKNKPPIVVSTKNKKLIEETKHNTDIILCMYDDYIDYQDQYLLNYKKRMVSAQVLIRDTDEEARLFIEENYKDRPRVKRWTVYGSRDTVKKKILNMASEGITDVMVNHGIFDYWQDPSVVDDLIYEIICEQKKI